jgi:hypothetical protein
MKCKFNHPYHGVCNKESGNDFCIEHIDIKCFVCKNKVIKLCDAGSCCGMPLCKNCYHENGRHGSKEQHAFWNKKKV